MGLAIDGNEVHGIARGGQAFVSIGNTNVDGSISLNGHNYLNENNMEIKDTGKFDIDIAWQNDSYSFSASPVDVTNNLSNYGGYLAICIIHYPGDKLSTMSHPFVIPTAPTDSNLLFQFDLSSWWGELSRTTDNKFTFTPHYTNANTGTTATGEFYILSNN